MTFYQPSFFIKNCTDSHVDLVSGSIKNWCKQYLKKSLANVATRRDLHREQDDLQWIIYVNVTDDSFKRPIMDYIKNDLNKSYHLNMVCRVKDGRQVTQYSLLLKTNHEKPPAPHVRSIFKKYDECDITIHDHSNTFINFDSYENSKDAYWMIEEDPMLLDMFHCRVVPIQYTKILMRLEQKLSDKVGPHTNNARSP